MTNSHIRSEVANALLHGDVQNSPQALLDDLTGRVVEIVAQAYDEVAKIAEEEATGLKLETMARYDEGYDTACLEIAAEIRTLRDSLVASSN